MRWFKRWYGASPLHLLTLIASFALAGYAAQRLLPRDTVAVAVWFAGAVIGHDLILMPLYALADRSVVAVFGHRRSPHPPTVSWINYLRVPAVLSGLLLLIWFPLIFRLPSRFTVLTSLSLDPYQGRWLAVTGVLFLLSAVVLALRLSTRPFRRAARRGAAHREPAGAGPLWEPGGAPPGSLREPGHAAAGPGWEQPGHTAPGPAWEPGHAASGPAWEPGNGRPEPAWGAGRRGPGPAWEQDGGRPGPSRGPDGRRPGPSRGPGDERPWPARGPGGGRPEPPWEPGDQRSASSGGPGGWHPGSSWRPDRGTTGRHRATPGPPWEESGRSRPGPYRAG